MDELTRMFDRLVQLRNEGRITRRQFAKLTGGGVGVTAISAFLAACGAAPDDSEGGSRTSSRRDGSSAAPTAAAGSSGGDNATPDTGSGSSESSSSGGTGEIKRGGKLVFGLDTAPIGFDPHMATAFASQMFYEHMYESLFQFTPTLEVIPALATGFDIIDEQTYEFHIREGVKFQDGSLLTAEDVKFSYERMIDPDLKSTRAPWFSRIEGIEVTGPLTVVVHLSEPFSPLLGFMAMPGAAIVSKAFTEQHDNDLANVSNGTGPFQLTHYETNQFGSLPKFADHWRGEVPYVDEMEIRLMTDESSRVAALRAKEVDMTRLFEQQNADIIEREGYQLYKGLATSRTMTFINCRNAPFDDVRVRQALAYAIDRQAMIDTALLGEGEMSGPIPPVDVTWALTASDFETYQPNIEKARALLAEAGYPDGFNATLTVSPQYAFDVANAQVMQEQLRPLGINIEIQQVEWGNLLDTLNNTRNFELLNVIYTHQPDPDGYLYNYYHSESTNNHSGISDPRLDQLLADGRRVTDPAERKRIYDEAQRLVVDELVPSLSYYIYYQYLPAQEWVKGFKPIPTLSRIYMREIWLDK